MYQLMLKTFASATSRLLTTSAQLAKKQAELATIRNVTLPQLHHAVGKRLVKLDKLPSDLASHRETIQALEATLEQNVGVDGVEPAIGLAAKAKQLAKQVAKKTTDAATGLQLRAAFAALGKAAIEKYGRKPVPKELVGQLDTAEMRIAELSAEITSLKAE